MRQCLSLALSTLSASLLAACSPARLLSASQPLAPGGEAQDIAYGPGPRHSLDLYLPEKTERPPPVVVFFYGGGWRSGERASYRFVGRSLAACGAITVIPDYRVWPDTGFPGFLRDAAASVAAARDLAALRGGDPSRLFLMGHSAGAYIATMLALDPRWLAGAGVDSRSALSGVIGLAGPYDFLPLNDPELEQIFAPVGPNTQPITFAANAGARLLLATGEDDRVVNPANSTRLAAKVRDTGGLADVIVYPRIGHMSILGAIAAPLRFLAPVRDNACDFLGLTAVSTPRTADGGTPKQVTAR